MQSERRPAAIPSPFDAAKRRGRAGRELLHHDHAIIDVPCHARLVTLAHREAGQPKRTPNGAAAGNGPVGRRERSTRARDIWISSGLRSGASGLRESPAFGRLDLFGIPWILSSEMSLFNGLQATWGRFYFSRGPFPSACVTKGRPSSILSSTAMKRLAGRKRPGALMDHGSRHREVRSGHWDQTNAVFAFWQGIVDWAPFYTKVRRGSLCRLGRRMRVFQRTLERGGDIPLWGRVREGGRAALSSQGARPQFARSARPPIPAFPHKGGRRAPAI